MRHHPTTWLYALLLAVRAALLFAPGYIHPDEFFQSAQPAASLLGGASPPVWEFGAARLRSWLPPLAMSSPLWLLRRAQPHPSSAALLCAARAVPCALSLVQDWAVLRVSASAGLRRRRALLLHASAWPTLTLAARPFANSLEASLLALALGALAPALGRGETTRRARASLGALGALGVYCRASFAAFFLPVALALLRPAAPPRAAAWRRALDVLAGAAPTALLAWAVDCRVYGGAPLDCLTPLNFVRYNSETANLAAHGLHPRWTHALVNLPLLSLPLVAAAGRELCSAWRVRPSANGRGGSLPPATRRLLQRCVAWPLVGLSLVPHQEPRFLLPLMVPIVLLYGWRIRGRRAILLWITWNVAGVLVFGFLHQAGLLPALAYLRMAAGLRTHPSVLPASASSHAFTRRTPAIAIFFHTYMPPPFLLGTDAASSNLDLHDLKVFLS
ncbi:hypothetical protein AB1Y20_000853 [Prymnesium parvum]|uniref:Mannosyltransferase n=1 Tax=Prymnesium parvum TaxID=97485 RepID=A0AB34K733_PRYPA